MFSKIFTVATSSAANGESHLDNVCVLEAQNLQGIFCIIISFKFLRFLRFLTVIIGKYLKTSE